jgi:hypothetical protein
MVCMKADSTKTNPPLALKHFQDMMGVSRCTIYRYRRLGWLTVINIAGRPYVTPEAATDFNRRAAAGEFKKAPHGVAATQRKGSEQTTSPKSEVLP